LIFCPTPDHYTAFNWCINNDIFIYPIPTGKKFYLVAKINGTERSSFKEYTKQVYEEKIWEYYLYLYKKYKDV
tara:strand:+ start:62 stop:280 length:219 start_codon:yes stop_codon:yes gene_type:complete